MKRILRILLDEHTMEPEKATEVIERLENDTQIIWMKSASSYRNMCAILPAHVENGKVKMRYVLRLVMEDESVFPSRTIIHELSHFIAITNQYCSNGLICKWGICCNLYQIKQGKVRMLSMDAQYIENEKANCIATDYIMARLRGKPDDKNRTFVRAYLSGSL